MTSSAPNRACSATSQPPAAIGHAERRTRWVVGLTAVMMVAELVVGTITKSLSLVADGWHMATHAGALGLAALAYWYARTRASEASFTFGTGKVFALTGFTNAIVLILVALAMLTEGVRRLVAPEQVRFDEALPVAVIGFVVNIVSFFLLHPGGQHGHDHHGHHDHAHHDHAHHDHHAHHAHHDHAHASHEHDVNLRAAYLHVAADALTSLTAIAALLGGRYFGWVFLDPLMAILGSAVILKWGVGLVRQSGRQLLDVVSSPELEAAIRRNLEALGEVEIRDLHVWEIGPGKRGCIVALTTTEARPLEVYRGAVLEAAAIEHLTVEIDHVPAESRAAF
jgi:cation diffusion facilitator family transporter